MTAIIAVRADDGTVALAGDSFCGDKRYADLCQPKVQLLTPVLGVGVSGDPTAEVAFLSAMRVLAKKRNLQERHILVDLPEMLAKEAAKLGVESPDVGDYLIVHQGSLYVVDHGVGVYRSARGVACVGCGSVAALAAALAWLTDPIVIDRTGASNIATGALEIAAEVVPFVRGPFTTVTVR